MLNTFAYEQYNEYYDNPMTKTLEYSDNYDGVIRCIARGLK